MAGVLVGYFVWGTKVGVQAVAANPQGQAQVAPTQPFRRYDIPTEGFHSLGPADAPITVRGVPGADGQLPVIDGDGATTRTNLIACTRSSITSTASTREWRGG